MHVSYRWLSRHVDLTGITPQQLAEDLTLSTAEVEGLEPFAPCLSDVVVGHVLERVPHPDADKLGVCTVDVGGEAPLQIVCGAPNVRGGHRVAVATVGTVLPGDFKIKKSKIRGVESVGMICSERELGLGDEHDGIWVLPEDAPVGRPVAEALGVEDWVIEIDNKSLTHRPDLWGHRGIAREVAAIYGRELRPLDTTLPEHGDGTPVPVRLEGDDTRRYVALPLEGVEQTKSPLWLKLLLLAVDQRPLDLLVDLSNFVMLDLGQPNHAFDGEHLSPEGLVVRRARAGETIQTLDEVERKLTPEDLLICSGDRPVALAGIMGGEGSKVQPGTSRLVLEVATFDAVRVRRTSSRLALRTDSSARFEKHLDPTLPLAAAAHFARLLQAEQPGVRLPAPPTDLGDWSDPSATIELDPVRVNRALGDELPPEDMVDILTRLGFGVEPGDGVLRVHVPSWRATRDVTLAADLVEEIGRIHRYGNLPERNLGGEIVPPVHDATRELVRDLQDRLAGAARFHEQISYSFQSDELLGTLGLAGDPHVSVINPVQEGVSKIRRTVLPSLVGLVAKNRRHREEVRLFEVGKGYRPEDANELGEPREVHELAVVLSQPHDPEAPVQARSLARLQAVLDDLMRGVNLPRRAWGEVPAEGAFAALPPYAHPVRRTGLYVLGRGESPGSGSPLGHPVGWAADLDPGIARDLGLEGELRSDTAIATLDLAALRERRPEVDAYVPLPRFPAAKVDVALVVPDTVRAAQVAATIEQAAKGRLRALEVFDVYRGEALGADRRSLAYHVSLASGQGTLSDKDVAKFLERLQRVLEPLGVELRS